MGRSVWKGVYVKLSLLKKVLKGKKKVFRTYSRNSVIIPKMVGLAIRVHDGKKFSRVKLEEGCVGCKLGELVATRGEFEYKKKKKKKVK